MPFVHSNVYHSILVSVVATAGYKAEDTNFGRALEQQSGRECWYKKPRRVSPTAIPLSCTAIRPGAPAKFYRVCFGSEQDGWVHKAIDSRDCTLPNKELLAEWIETYGVDSDFVRVRVRGLPPTADELQFIDRERIKEAQEREPQSLDDDPLICGVDVSGGGAAWNVAALLRRTRTVGGPQQSTLMVCRRRTPTPGPPTVQSIPRCRRLSAGDVAYGNTVSRPCASIDSTGACAIGTLAPGRC